LRRVLVVTLIFATSIACAESKEKENQPAAPAVVAPSVTLTSSPRPRATWPPELPELYQRLPTPDDLAPQFVLAVAPHSVAAAELPPGPPNARVLFELEKEPANHSEISCLTFYFVELASEEAARSTYQSFEHSLVAPARETGQIKAQIEAPPIGDESAAATLVSTMYEIGTCGSRPVFAYAGVTFRRGAVVAEVLGFTPKDRPSPELLWEMARLQLTRLESRSFK
jgi:hypothetical protein